jgi:hypothetical protein
MPRRSLTDRFCANAKVAEGQMQTDYYDEGRPGLTLRVSLRGSKTWSYVFPWAGRRARMSLGTYPTYMRASRVKNFLPDQHFFSSYGRERSPLH